MGVAVVFGAGVEETTSMALATGLGEGVGVGDGEGVGDGDGEVFSAIGVGAITGAGIARFRSSSS